MRPVMPVEARARVPRPLVLVVDDNVDAQLITSATLVHIGFEVMAAGTVQQARTLAGTRRPDVVVLDCRLPDGDGLGLAERWRRDPAMSDVPVIVLTAFSARQDMEAAILAGADAFLVKPVTGIVLGAQIERLLQGHRPSQQLRSHPT